MSFILDALKKSESERQKRGTAEFAGVPSSSGGPRAPRWLWLFAALLAINLVVLLGLLMREEAPTIVPSNIAVPQAVEQADADTSFAERVAVARSNQPPRQADAELPPQEAVAVPPVDPPAPATSLQILPTANELRVNGTLQIAELHIDLHVYNAIPAERLVFINNAKYRENSRLAEGPLIEEITREGVILSYRGMDFLLPRE